MKALLLLAFGGPRSLDEVEFLLSRLLGRKPSPEMLERVKERYRLIGGFSPLPAVTENQAKALEERLHAKGHAFKSYVGMRYSQPLIEETLKAILQDGMEEVVALPMAPFRSQLSTGAYQEELNQAHRLLGAGLRIRLIEGWHRDPLFIGSVAEKVEEGLRQFAFEERGEIHLIFTAHSLPEEVVRKDPYVHDMKESVDQVLKRIEPLPWHIAFQSKGGGAEKWIGPDVETVLSEIRKIGVRKVLVVPIGFVSDHIEILYDIDILYKGRAESLGMTLKRTRSLNHSAGFIEALAQFVEGHMERSSIIGA